MLRSNRREFVGDVSKGMLIAGLGTAAAAELGLDSAWAAEDRKLRFGADEPLVAMLQETTPDKIVAAVVAKLKNGTTLKQITAAASLANARAFGGEDYIGYHTLMALGPALDMSGELQAEEAALPVLKVVHRNSVNLHNTGGCSRSALEVVDPAALPNVASETALREITRNKDKAGAEKVMYAAMKESPEKAYDQLLFELEDDVDVHRTVLAFRAWELLDVVGRDRADAMLRQSVRYCVDAEIKGYGKNSREVRTLVPKLMEQNGLTQGNKESRQADDAWVARFSETIFSSSPAAAAESVAMALKEGFSAKDVGEAIAIAANQLVLRDSGRDKAQSQPNKPVGSVHGDGIGVHACDSVHAWRGISAVASPRHRVASLILAAYHIARDRCYRADSFLKWAPYPRAEHLARLGAESDRATLLKKLDGVIRDKDQAAATAVAHRLGEIGCPATDVCAILRKFAISEDGALHAEKYYRTATSEFAALRPAFRWTQITALARVTASAFGYPGPGVDEARKLMRGLTTA
jgi:hypothetical protein